LKTRSRLHPSPGETAEEDEDEEEGPEEAGSDLGPWVVQCLSTLGKEEGKEGRKG
jgi:hypothetical protein